ERLPPGYQERLLPESQFIFVERQRKRNRCGVVDHTFGAQARHHHHHGHDTAHQFAKDLQHLRAVIENVNEYFRTFYILSEHLRMSTTDLEYTSERVFRILLTVGGLFNVFHY